jgi:glutaminyl-peptide cyclotransferase
MTRWVAAGAAALALAAVPAACGGDDGEQADARSRPTADRFDSARAFANLERQVRLGERPAGSPASRRLARWAKRKLPNGRFEAIPGHPGLRNVVGHVKGTRPAILVGAHYDTKDIPGFVGAEDGAGGTAAVLELARYFRRAQRPRGAPEIRFVLFDGEESTDDSRPFEDTGLRGSKAYARRHAKRLQAVIILDFIAQKDLSIPYEPNSDRALWGKLRAAAKRVGALDVFPDAEQSPVSDDHIPFARRGVPAIDLIDFDFPCWHETCDDMSAVSERSLDKSGETVLELLRSWR